MTKNDKAAIYDIVFDALASYGGLTVKEDGDSILIKMNADMLLSAKLSFEYDV